MPDVAPVMMAVRSGMSCEYRPGLRLATGAWGLDAAAMATNTAPGGRGPAAHDPLHARRDDHAGAARVPRSSRLPRVLTRRARGRDRDDCGRDRAHRTRVVHRAPHPRLRHPPLLRTRRRGTSVPPAPAVHLGVLGEAAS